MKKRRALFLSLLFLVLFSLPVMAASVKTIKKGQKTLSLNVGKKYVLKVKNKTAKWTAKNTSVCQLTKKGLIKAKKAGTAKLAYKIGSRKYTIKIVVKNVKKRSSSSAVSGNSETGNSESGSSASGSGGSGSSGAGTVYWVPNGEVYHSTSSCRSLSRSKTICSGPLSSCPKTRACKNCH